MQRTDDAADATDVIDAEIDRLQGADSLAETPYAALFHTARTSTPDTPGNSGYTGVTCQVRVRDGEIETSDPVKTRQGQHLRGTGSWDGKLSLTVKPFLDVNTARQEIVRQLRDLQRTYQVRAQRERGQA